jgi:hypothetical protein
MKWLVVTLLCAAGCSIHAVNPHPSVVVGGNSAPLRLDVTAVSDQQPLDGTLYTIDNIKTSLENGLANAAGDKYRPDSPQSIVLKITQLEFKLASSPRFIGARYRAKWVAPGGREIAEVAGTARPRNPFETSPQRQLEDVIEVMYEKIVDGYEKTAR